MIRLLLDQGLPYTSASILNTSGWDVVHTHDVNLSQASDAEILSFAVENDRICVTLDADFHTILAVNKMIKPSVIRIRQEGLKAQDVASLLERALPKLSDDLAQGAMITIQKDIVRKHRLPIVK